MEDTEKTTEDKPAETEEKKADETSEDKAEESDDSEAPLDRADRINKETRALNKERLEIVEREEKLEAVKMVGGVAEAGKPSEEKKEETPKEYKDRVMAGEI